MPERKCCPECRTVSIKYNLEDSSFRGDDPMGRWYCSDCQMGFENPETKHVEPKRARSASGVLKAAGFGEHADEADGGDN
jgi:hypothetical protein